MKSKTPFFTGVVARKLSFPVHRVRTLGKLAHNYVTLIMYNRKRLQGYHFPAPY